MNHSPGYGMNLRIRNCITLLGLVLLLTLSACGQKGDLYLPDKKAAVDSVQTGLPA